MWIESFSDRLTLSQRRRRSGQTHPTPLGSVSGLIEALAPDAFAVGSGLNEAAFRPQPKSQKTKTKSILLHPLHL